MTNGYKIYTFVMLNLVKRIKLKVWSEYNCYIIFKLTVHSNTNFVDHKTLSSIFLTRTDIEKMISGCLK